jgi:type IV pilus assembly protein PilC
MLASLQSSGVTLKNALVLMTSMSDKGRVNELAADLASILDRGESLSTAIAARAETFPPIYRGMVAIGERIGSMESVIPQLARLLREKKAIRDRTRSALAYPILVLLVTVLGGIGIVVFLLPRLEELFASLGGVTAAAMRERVATLKALAQGLSGFALSSGMLALLCAALRRRCGRAAAIIDGLLLRSPLAGPALLSYETHNFSFAMEALVRGGVPMELALSEAATIAGNAAFRAAVLRARDRVMKGEPLSAAFRAQGEFPRYMAVWVALGESTGQVDRVFAQVACYFRGDIDRRGAYFLALVEPALILLVGGAVLFFVLFFIVPLFGMYGSIF